MYAVASYTQWNVTAGYHIKGASSHARSESSEIESRYWVSNLEPGRESVSATNCEVSPISCSVLASEATHLIVCLGPLAREVGGRPA